MLGYVRCVEEEKLAELMLQCMHHGTYGKQHTPSCGALPCGKS